MQTVNSVGSEHWADLRLNVWIASCARTWLDLFRHKAFSPSLGGRKFVFQAHGFLTPEPWAEGEERTIFIGNLDNRMLTDGFNAVMVEQ